MELTSKRVLYTDDGITSVLIHGNREVCRLLEEEWKNNERNISSIPEGSYLCKRYVRPSGLVTFAVTGVPNRDYILFHPGTTEKDTDGCLLTGMEIGELDAKDEESGKVEKQLAIFRSKEGFEKFMALVGSHESFMLHIKNC